MQRAKELFAAKFTPPAEFPRGGIALPSLTGSAKSFLAAALAEGETARVVLVVTPGIPEAESIFDDLKLLTSESATRVMEFPPKLEVDKASLGIRLKAIAALRAWSLDPYPLILVAPYPALLTPVPSGVTPALRLGTDPKSMESMGTDPKRFVQICENLVKIGYIRVPTVEKEGDFAVRGGILDAWSPGEEFPIRAEFFGDDLESLRSFDAATQISVERLTETTLLPIETEPTDPLLGDDSLLGDRPRNGKSLVELLPREARVLAVDHNAYSLSEFSDVGFIYLGDPAPAGALPLPFTTSPLPGFAELGAEEAHHPELFDAARKRLDRHLAAAKQRGDHIAKLDSLSGGFEIDGLLVVAKSDRVFAKRHRKPPRRAAAVQQSGGARINDFDELEPGEYVVHVDHGVGRFVGSSEIVTGETRTEVFTIEYADGALLHVPATQAHLLSRYVGVKGEAVRVHRLDGKRWNRDKAEAQRAVADLASALLETQARRETIPGFACDVACEGKEAFDAAFPYEETEDQRAAIAAIERDLGSTKPMDRLICGDAGYGKTEVAMRAAFIAAMNGKQVAVLAPTTVLAEQHFETFTSRFDGTPVRIEAVSRFQSADTHSGTFKRLESGVCDIVIGTHAILSPKIRFHDLGLIIIDEEQRFGVRHKEWLKSLRATADVLTLSATPIPRTLYLSMTGARDLSLLRSPPRERVAVETKVVRDSDEIVRAAIERELARDGQIFFLHNRVTTLSRVEKRLKALLPTLRIATAHGQMDSRSLARIMRDFEARKFDVLLSTTIVESGIDIPNANTIIIDQADHFGMAELYQLRGRVGRSARQGHAIFLLPPSGIIESEARERLDALQHHGGLGAGFNLAMRDLELRGAGNLLGSQQSGHIAAVGFGLYCQLLQRTIALLKGEKVREIVDVKLSLDFIDYSPSSDDPESAAALPYEYVEEDSQRMNFMKRLAEAQDVKAVNALAAELEDRFGKPPTAAKRLINLTKLKVRLAAAGFDRVDVKGARAVYYRTGESGIAKVVDLKGKTPDRKIVELNP